MEAIEEKYIIENASLKYYKGKPRYLHLQLVNRKNDHPLMGAVAHIGRRGKAEMKGALSDYWSNPSTFGIETPVMEKKRDCIEYVDMVSESKAEYWIRGYGGKCEAYIDALNRYRTDADASTFVIVYRPLYESMLVDEKIYRAIRETRLETDGKFMGMYATIDYNYREGRYDEKGVEEWHIQDGNERIRYEIEDMLPATTKKQLISRMMDVMMMYFNED
jgi:hypothetical protein